MPIAFLVLFAVLPLPIGSAPPEEVATLIVLNKSDATASLIDPDTGETRALVETGEGPHEVAVTEDGALAVVADYGQSQPGNTLTVIDVARGEVTRKIDLGKYGRPHGLVFVAGTANLLVTSETQRALLEVDVASGEILQVIRTEANVSHMVAVASDAGLAFVANIGSGSVSVLDLVKGIRTKTIPTGEGCEGVDVSPDGKEVWVSNRGIDRVSVIDVATLEVEAELETTGFPIRVKFTPDGTRALVSCAAAEEVLVFDTKTRKRIAAIPMTYAPAEGHEEHLFGQALADKAAPIGIVIRPDGKRAYVANTNADLVAVVDLEKLAVVGTIRAGREPDGLGWSVRR